MPKMQSMTAVYPLKFEPIYKEKIWGGRNLHRLFARPLPAGAKIGESWELADLKEGVSLVSNGPRAGRTITEILREWGADLLGAARPSPGGRFPLLLKILDANDILSLQVHPDEKAAAAIGPEAAPKTECWFVVESRDGFIYKGVQPGVTAEQLRAAIEANTVQELLRRIELAKGDFHYLPAGTVHAIGPGVVLAEVQTPSDTTYRVTDWGRGREIHVERSMQCIRFDLRDEQPGKEGDTLLATPYFTVVRGRGRGPSRAWLVPPGRGTAVMFLGGRSGAEIRHRGRVEPVLPARPGDTVLLPAALERAAVAAPTDCEFLVITFPDSP